MGITSSALNLSGFGIEQRRVDPILTWSSHSVQFQSPWGTSELGPFLFLSTRLPMALFSLKPFLLISLIDSSTFVYITVRVLNTLRSHLPGSFTRTSSSSMFPAAAPLASPLSTEFPLFAFLLSVLPGPFWIPPVFSVSFCRARSSASASISWVCGHRMDYSNLPSFADFLNSPSPFLEYCVRWGYSWCWTCGIGCERGCGSRWMCIYKHCISSSRTRDEAPTESWQSYHLLVGL